MPEWAQYLVVFVAVTSASAWLTARWLARRRPGACSRCETPCERALDPDTRCMDRPAQGDGRGLRSPALQVMRDRPS